MNISDNLKEKAIEFYHNGQFDKFIRRIIKEKQVITDEDVYLATEEHFSKSDLTKLQKLATIFIEIEPPEILKIEDPSQPYLIQYIYTASNSDQYQLNLGQANETKFILTKLEHEKKYSSTKTLLKTPTCQVTLVSFNDQSKKISINGDKNEGFYFILNDYIKTI